MVRKKKKLKRKNITSIHFLMAFLTISTSYAIVAWSAPFGVSNTRESGFENLTRSASRIAVAFEIYNQKRFDH